jgi:hypothetical protein
MREWFAANPAPGSGVTWSDLAAEALAYAKGTASKAG